MEKLIDDFIDQIRELIKKGHTPEKALKAAKSDLLPKLASKVKGQNPEKKQKIKVYRAMPYKSHPYGPNNWEVQKKKK